VSLRVDEAALRLWEAKKKMCPTATLTSENTTLSLSDAYIIQGKLLEMAKDAGAVPCGYKMGLTSRAKQNDVQVFEPIHGFLLSEMEIENGGEVNTQSLIHPRAEPEIAVVMRKSVAHPLSHRELLSCIEAILPAMEILDSRYKDFQFKLPDVVADNTSASGFILGSRNWISECQSIPFLGVTVRKNGEICETGCPAAVLGNPLNSLMALIRALSREEIVLEAGSVVLTGGITASIPLFKGDFIEVEWPGEALSLRAR